MSRIHNVQRVNGKVDPHVTMSFRDFTYDIGVYQDANGIYLHFDQSWHWCENDGSAFLLWGKLKPGEKNHITSRSTATYVKDQVYIETFRDNQACVLCLPEDPRMYLEYDVVDANGVLQQTRLDLGKDALEMQVQKNFKKIKKNTGRRRHMLKKATNYQKIPRPSSCFFMSDGTFRYKPGEIRPMLD